MEMYGVVWHSMTNWCVVDETVLGVVYGERKNRQVECAPMLICMETTSKIALPLSDREKW